MAQNAQAGQVSNAPSGKTGKDLVNKDGKVTELIEWATQSDLNPEQLMDKFMEADVPVSSGEELTGDYKVVHSDEKPGWCTAHIGRRLFAVQWHFYKGQGTNDDGSAREFAAIHIVSNAGKFIVNDGAQGGMYGQLRRITDVREDRDANAAEMRTSTAGLMVPGGLRANKTFYYSTVTKKAIPRAELDNVEKWPMSEREESRQTWSFDL